MDQHDCLCARCAKVKVTCCEEGREIYVTPGDVRRIQAYTGLDGFHTFRAPGDPVYLDQSDDPAWESFVFQADGTRRILRQVDAGRCMFLGQAGCMMPVEVRPLVCRMYPYDYTEQGIKDQPAEGCPVHLLRPGEDLFVSMSMNLEDARRWHRQLYEEIRLEKTASCASA